MSLPQGWCLASIADTGKYINGFAFKPEHWGDAGRPIIRIQNLTKVDREINRTTFVPGDEFVVRQGDILVSWSATLDAFIWDREEALVNQHIFRVIPESGLVTKKYLFYLLKEAIQEMQKTEHLHGSTMKHINRGPFMAHKIPIAPRTEQSRIVDEIEKQFTRLDDAVAALKRVLANLKRYRASVLKAACEGRLVPTEAELARKEGRSYEPASELLQRILAERRAKWEADQLQKMIAAGKPLRDAEWKRRYPEPVAPNAGGLPAIPKGWAWATCEQLSDRTRAITYGVIKLGEEVTDGVPTLRSSDVRQLRIERDHVKSIEPDIARNFARTFLRGGEVLVTVRGTLGGVAVVPEDCTGFNISREVAMIAPQEPRTAQYLAYSIASPNRQIWLLTNTAGIAYTGVNIETLKQLPIPLPPLDEQMRITSALEQQITNIDTINNEVVATLKRWKQLRNGILTKAFSGQLVPQVPNDEPASALLERIRAERVALATNNGNQMARPKAGTANGQRRRRIARLAHRVSGGKGAEK